MSLCQPLSPSGSFILDWSQSESLGHNIDIKGVGQAKLSESGKERGAGYPRLPRSCTLLEKRSKKARESKTSKVAVRILMCVYIYIYIYLVHGFSLGLYLNKRQCFTFVAVCLFNKVKCTVIN